LFHLSHSPSVASDCCSTTFYIYTKKHSNRIATTYDHDVNSISISISALHQHPASATATRASIRGFASKYRNRGVASSIENTRILNIIYTDRVSVPVESPLHLIIIYSRTVDRKKSCPAIAVRWTRVCNRRDRFSHLPCSPGLHGNTTMI
jgi:hypothetical protein